MNGEQALAKIRSTIQQKIAETPAVQKLIDKINSGKATYADTALYARWAAINLGMCLSGVICEIDLNDRAAVCKALMLDQYRDINGFVDIVQSELDSRFGIQLAPQRAPFNKERADTIGHSLADTTKPDDVIERRAENAVANAVESMHDDRMQAESKFRSRLGLTVVIERTGANCCPWCAEVAGKYRYGEEPEGVFRRHDNCNCTIIYDSQVLRGAVGEDGRRTKTWAEVNPEKVRGFEPDVNTPEQAKALEETALQGLTLPEKRGKIKLGINLFDMSDELYVEAFSIEEEKGFTDVYLHGSPVSVQIIVNGKPKNLTPDEFEKLLKSKGLSDGDIRLCSCSTGFGDNSFAQQLSKIHNGKVKAPDSDVYYAPDEGTVFLGDPNANVGRWRIFENGDEVT